MLEPSNICALILAAGRSSRFGESKMLATLEGKPLILHAAENTLEHLQNVRIVLGREAEKVKAALENLTLEYVENPHFASGMSSSIKAGIQALEPSDFKAALIVLADQPRVPQEVFRTLLEESKRTNLPIMVPIFQGLRGHPALFAREIWPELRALEGDSGGKAVIEQNPARVQKVYFDFPVPADVDTLEDLVRLEN
jgi:molybdenum cofactor cytidylyltransferase